MSLLSIPLDVGFVSKVKTGDKIVSGQVIATKKISAKDIEVNVPETLNIKPEEAIKFILKKPGDRIEEGALIAAKKGAFGMGGNGIKSKVNGTVFKIDEELGIIYVRTIQNNFELSTRVGEEEDIFSPVDGVVELCDNNKIAIKTEKDAILADKATGTGIISAEAILLGKDEVDSDSTPIKSGSIGVDPVEVNGKIVGKIILGRTFQKEAVSKALAIGAIGIISQNISDDELKNLMTKNINTPIFIVSGENFDKLVKYSGKKIYADTEKSIIIPL